VELDPQSEVIKVQQFGRAAKAFCVLVFVMLGVTGAALLSFVLFGRGWSGLLHLGPYAVRGDTIMPLGLQIWALVYTLLAFTTVVIAGGYLHALFGALARGEIYTMVNVRRIRRVGQLVLAMGVLQIVLPVVSTVLLNAGVVPESAITRVSFGAGPDSLTLMIAAGLILLVSWIMEVGRRTSEETERMRREAELVV
jgi:hypothetical protein